jgi:SAM-dependent methyltransferase
MGAKTFHEIELAAWSERAGYYDALFGSVSTQAIDDILDCFGALAGKRHLDVACGTGHLVAAASRRGATSEGIDFAQSMIDTAGVCYPRERFQVADAAQLPYGVGSFDAVTCAFGLSHMQNPQAAVNEAYRVLKSGGRFAFTLWYGADDGNEYQAILQDALAAYVINPITIPEEWTRLRDADEAICRSLTERGGFGQPVFKKLPIVMQTNSAVDVVALLDKMSVRTKMVIEHQPPEIKQRIFETIGLKSEARRTNGVISLAWPALLTCVQKPG